MTATIETSLGKIEIELYPDDAPKTVANFAGLAEQAYFNGVIFHRISKGFVIQGGDSTGTGSGSIINHGIGFLRGRPSWAGGRGSISSVDLNH